MTGFFLNVTLNVKKVVKSLINDFDIMSEMLQCTVRSLPLK